MGYGGSERTTRRAVAEAKAAWRAGHGAGATGRGSRSRGCGCSGTGARARGSAAGGRSCSAAGWPGRGSGWCSRRGTRAWARLTACLDRALRAVGGAPTYLLTDNAQDGDRRACGRDPGAAPGHGGAGPALRLQGGDLRAIRPGVQGRHRGHGEDRQGGPGARRGEPAPEYASFAELEAACGEFCERVNGRVHRESAAVPAQRLAAERAHLHPLPAEPYVLALGEERLVNDDQTIRFGSVRYSTPPGHAGDRVWCRVPGASWSSWPGPARAGRDRPPPPVHARAARGSATSTTRITRAGTGRASPGPGPAPRPRRRSWAGRGRARWLIEAAAAGAQRVRAKMARAVELAAVVGAAQGRRRPSGWRRSPAGSPTMTCLRSSTTWPRAGRPGRW